MAQEIYHETQVQARCLLHSLNNLFQDRYAFDCQSLDEICHNLDSTSMINPHRSILGIGDYDINVLNVAVGLKGYATRWFDRRTDPETLRLDNIYGFVVNTPDRSAWRLLNLLSFTSQRHWYTLRNVRSEEEVERGVAHYWNLDSTLPGPLSLGNNQQFLNYLRTLLASDEQIYVVLVISQQVAENNDWIN